MDKLKPIIEQKFWIFLGLALILPFVGWYLAASGYAKGVEERESLIDGTFDKMEFAGPVPNPVWIQGAQEIVQDEQQRLQAAQQKLWNSQKQNMIWPSYVQPFMKDVPYEGNIHPTAREYYSQGYFDQLKDIEQELQPLNFETGEGVLLFDPNSYTHVPYGQWDRQPPTSQEMWNAQIDTWLVKAVFDSIKSMNQGSKKITEAPIRKIIQLTLRGGERDYSAATAGTEGSGDSSGLYEEMDFSSSGEYGGGGSARSFDTNVSFDLSEELGPQTQGGFGGANYSESFDSSSGGYGDSGYSDSAGGESKPAGPDRYVDDDEGFPFRTRAFVLGVYMEHTQLPEFMAELSRSDWPIQIIRVQMRAVNLDQLPLVNRSGTRRSTYGVPSGGLGSGYGGSSTYNPGSYSDDGGEGYGNGFSPIMPSGESYGDSDSGIGGIRPGISGIAPGANPAARNAVGLAQQAMSDPNLAEVWIGGLITLFRPVENASAEGSQAPGTTAGTAPPVDGAAADPNAAQQDTPPGAGQQSTAPSPADGATAPDAEGTDGFTSPSSPADGAEETTPATESSTGTDN